jgi:hypothetical protein
MSRPRLQLLLLGWGLLFTSLIKVALTESPMGAIACTLAMWAGDYPFSWK